MRCRVGGMGSALVLALLLPMLGPLARLVDEAAEACACRAACCPVPRPSPTGKAPCHAGRPEQHPCVARCDHPGSDAPPTTTIEFLPEFAASFVTLPELLRPPFPGEEPRPGYRRIESPPPRPLVPSI